MLACLQTLPQLASHTGAALNVGVEPVEIREAIYQLAPFIGFPRTINGVATINEVFAPGMTAMAAPVQRRGYPAIGVISIAGPLLRLTEKRMETLGPTLVAAASELAAASLASPLFARVR